MISTCYHFYQCALCWGKECVATMLPADWKKPKDGNNAWVDRKQRAVTYIQNESLWGTKRSDMLMFECRLSRWIMAWKKNPFLDNFVRWATSRRVRPANQRQCALQNANEQNFFVFVLPFFLAVNRLSVSVQPNLKIFVLVEFVWNEIIIRS